MLNLEPIFKIRIVYKSGHTEEFEVKSFKLSGGKAEWESIGPKRPILLGYDEIVAVGQLSSRSRIAR